MALPVQFFLIYVYALLFVNPQVNDFTIEANGAVQRVTPVSQQLWELAGETPDGPVPLGAVEFREEALVVKIEGEEIVLDLRADDLPDFGAAYMSRNYDPLFCKSKDQLLCLERVVRGRGEATVVFRDSRESTMEFVYRWTPPDADAGDADAEDAPNDAAEDETDDENDRTDAPDRNP